MWRKGKGDWDAWNTRSLAEKSIVRLILDRTSPRSAAANGKLRLRQTRRTWPPAISRIVAGPGGGFDFGWGGAWSVRETAKKTGACQSRGPSGRTAPAI